MREKKWHVPSGQKQEKMTKIWLFISAVLVNIVFYSHIFHVNRVIKITFRPQFSPQTHQQSDKKQEKMTKS